MIMKCCTTLVKPSPVECDSRCAKNTWRAAEIVPLVIAVTLLAMGVLAILARYDIVPQALNAWSATPTCPCPYGWGTIGLVGTVGMGLIMYKAWPVDKDKPDFSKLSFGSDDE